MGSFIVAPQRRGRAIRSAKQDRRAFDVADSLDVRATLGFLMLRRLILLALIASAALAQAPNKLFEQIGPILDGLSKISGWKVERKVPAEILHQSDFRKMMQAHMNDSGNKEVRAEELTLKMFGMVPPDFNLVGETVDLLSEQAAAFYDYNKKKLFILDTTLKGTKENEEEAQE